MADIPLKSDDEMTNDLVGAVENIAQSVKAGSRDFTKSFNGLTAAIKRLQTTLVNAIKSIKVQVVAKPEKTAKQPTKVKETATKEVVKEKETKTEVKPEPKAKVPKIEAEKTDVAKQPKLPKVVDPIQAAEKERIKKQKQDDADVRSQKLRDQAKIIALRLEEALKPKPIKEPKAAKEPKPIKEPKAAKEPKPPKVIDPLVEAEKQRKKKRADESAELRLQTQRNNAQLSALRLQSALTPKPEKKAPEPKPLKETKEERQVRSLGVPGTKKFVGPRLEEEDLANEKAKKDKEQADIAAANAAAKAISDAADAAAKAIEDAAKRKEKAEEDAAKAEKVLREYFRKKQEQEAQEIAKATADAAKAISDAADQAAADAAKALKNKNKAEEDADKAEKTLREYFRKKAEKEASDSAKAAQESAKAANDLVKQQEQAARQLEQANQRTQKELDSMIAGFQRLTPLFKGPLVSYGLKMIAKGVGYKQPQTLSKGGDVSYLADGGDASNPMKPKGTDTQPAMLTPGEFVVNKKASQDPENKKQLESINSGGNKRKLGDSISGSFLKSVISQYKQGKDAPKTEYRSSGGSIGGGGSSGVGYYASGGSVGGVGYYAAGGPVGAALGAAVTISGIVINSFTSAIKIASDAIATFGSFVAKANPAVMQKLEIIFNDLQGVIGRAVAPAFIYLTPLLRRFADYVDHGMKLIGPSISKVAVAFDNIVRPLLDLGSVLIEILNPVISLVSSLFLGISEIIKPLIQSFATLIGAVNDIVSVLVGWIPVADFVGGVLKAFGLVLGIALDMITTVASLFVSAIGAIIKGIGVLISKIPFMGSVGKGIAKGGDTLLQTGRNMRSNDPNRIKNGSSTGAAVREVQSMSISSVGDEIRKNAMMAGSGAKSQEDLLNDISNKLNKEELAAAFAAGNAKNPKQAISNLVGSNPFFKGLPNPVPAQNPV